MVNSICIKSNNNIVIQFLLNSLEKIDLNNVFVSQNKFKYYQNLIIHYRGPSIDLFYSKLADYLADLVISCYEKDLIKSMINCNYFYFDDIEKKKILNICNNTLLDIDKPQFYERKNIIFVSFLKYIIYNKYLVLDGFINFRLKDYISILDEAIDFSVNKFIIEKEFAEFVNLLKTYINSKKCNSNLVHIIYKNQESILIDEFNNLINMNDNIFESKYLSDISFSSNDYALNTLLTLLPKKIYIHLIDSSENDEFISTLQIIFDGRIFICNDCDICNLYKENKFKFFNQ